MEQTKNYVLKKNIISISSFSESESESYANGGNSGSGECTSSSEGSICSCQAIVLASSRGSSSSIGSIFWWPFGRINWSNKTLLQGLTKGPTYDCFLCYVRLFNGTKKTIVHRSFSYSSHNPVVSTCFMINHFLPPLHPLPAPLRHPPQKCI